MKRPFGDPLPALAGLLLAPQPFITHARTGAASFLSYEITVQHSKTRPHINGSIGLRVPRTVIKAKCAPYSSTANPSAAPSC